ncbi:MAG: glycosyltransferase [Fibrobacterales bacterium]
MKLAPIVLFVFNRLDHTQQTIMSLQKNKLASESDLTIYSDAGRDDNEKKVVDNVRAYLSTIDGFKNVTVVKGKENRGLANSIIEGVTEIINKYGKIIVIEDDLVTSPMFLTYMNNALGHFENTDKVWHISGWNYPILNGETNETFLWRTMNCWGWATWADKWQFYEKNIDKVLSSFSKKDINRFNLEGCVDLWEQVEGNRTERINTWAIFWYATIFKKQGLCLNPTQTYVKNIGHDGSGVNCGKSDVEDDQMLNLGMNSHFPEVFEENPVYVRKIKKYFKRQKKSLFLRIIKKATKILFRGNV